MLPSPPLPSLESLVLAELELDSAMLAAVASHTELTRLVLAGCRLPPLALSLAALPRLAHLDVQCIGKLQGTEVLSSLASTQLTHLSLRQRRPQHAAHMFRAQAAVPPLPAGAAPHVRHLSLWYNAVSPELGEGPAPDPGWSRLAGFTAVTELHLGGIWQAGLPHQLSLLASLQALTLSSTQVLDDGNCLAPLASLSCLTRLDIFKCHVPSLPPGLSALTMLCDLSANLSGELAGLPSICALHRLTRLALSVSHRGIMQLPQQASALSELHTLKLHAYVVEESWRHLATLPIVHLTASGCAIIDVPPVFALLTKLQTLDLSHNNLRGLKRLAHLPSTLSALSLRSCRLALVPAALRSLSGLQYLDLRGNEGGWGHFRPLAALPQLKALKLPPSCGLLGRKLDKLMAHGASCPPPPNFDATFYEQHWF